MGKEFIIYFLSILTCIGVPILIYLIHSRNKKELEIINTFVDPSIVEQAQELKKEKIQQNEEIKNYLESLEDQLINEPKKNLEQRVKQLESWKAKLVGLRKNSETTLIRLSKNRKEGDGSILFMLNAYSYMEHSEKIISKIDQLIEIENQ